ncbi:MAG: hypothetical protein M1832_005515 [Thelocarpon impressellum]|nr:MAG: hypothetical protein M1832_005515 [Thelocarpon impressellum]
MVFKPFTHLARPIFAKSFTHGYAQSVVAASQSSYASQTTSFAPFGNHSKSRFGKTGTPQLHSAFSNSASSGNGHHKGTAGHAGLHLDGGLAAYYAAWQQGHAGEGDHEWKQFQFAKRIGWKASNASEAKELSKDDVDALVEPRQSDPSRATRPRSHSSNALDDIKEVEDQAAAALAADTSSPDALQLHAITAATELEEARELANGERTHEAAPSTVASAPVAPVQSPALSTGSSGFQISPVSEATSATSVSDAQSQSYLEHISKLHDGQRYAEIPAVFESMLGAGVRPTTAAYNALLAAAVGLPAAKHLVIPKALGVYADMLRRRVSPDTATYSTLIEVLAARALEVSKMKSSLEGRRLRYGGMEEAGKFMFLSNEADFDILAEDDSLSVAVKLFDAATAVRTGRVFSTETYRSLTTACAEQGRVADMIRVYAHMEAREVIPSAAIFPPMITAFAASGDLSSAVECYNEYKTLAIAVNNGETSFDDRMDEEIYAAVVKAYLVCDKPAGAAKFFGKIQESYQSIPNGKESSLAALNNVVVPKAFVQGRVRQGLFAEALQSVELAELLPSVRDRALAEVCIASADRDGLKVAARAFGQITATSPSRVAAAASMLALYVRRGDVEAAAACWEVLSASDTEASPSLIEPTAMYTVALIGSGMSDEGLAQARQMFDRIRAAAVNSASRNDISEQVDEGIEFIGRFIAGKGAILSTSGTMELMWTMIENGGLVTPVVDQLLAGVGPEGIAQLSFDDLILMIQVQAGVVGSKQAGPDSASNARFGEMLRAVFASGLPIDERTQQVVERAIGKLGRPDLAQQWQNYLQPVVEQPYTPVQLVSQMPAPPIAARSSHEDSFDPYAASTDYKGSMVIVDVLEKNGGKSQGSRLDEALARFRNMRRLGRHPRYITYAKLISAAAREERGDLVHDILGMARTDVPLLPQYRLVSYGWASILDAMVGACLTLGKRNLAAQYHQELLDMGSAPTANTFGLYITTLKETAKTFDEATEAVKIFRRAKSEGVEPSSFLYNALIGKLGKARRIDDCLFYFAEMRGLGIRPTSVTYGTIVNALCRVSDEKFAEELFDEMEAMPNYKPRPAPYNSLIQFFLTTKRDRKKVLAYAERMKARNIQPTMHTYKLLIDAHATLEPVDMSAAEGLLEAMRKTGQKPEAVHYASLIHARGCVLHDMEGARKVFDDVLADRTVRPQACVYQAIFEAMVANHRVIETEEVLQGMQARRVEMTPYIANTLIHGWAQAEDVARSKAVYEGLGRSKREPSTYEAMARAFLAAEDREGAMSVVQEMLGRGYPAAVSGKIVELVSGGHSRTASAGVVA